MTKKDNLIQEFVNLYRQVNGSNAGLFTKDLNKMSIKQLTQSIYSLKLILNN